MSPIARRIASLGLAASLAAMAACGGAQAQRSSHHDTLRVVGPFEVHSLEPAQDGYVFTRLQVVETLVSSDLEGELEPGLATSWEEGDDRRSWRFELADEVTFHDGTPVTADAVAESLRRAAEQEASPLAEAPIDRIESRDTAVELRLDEPYPALPAVLTHYSTAIYAPGAYDARGRVTDVIGTGPYEIDEIELPASVQTARFSDYRGDAPEVAKVSFQAVGRPEQRALMAASNQADVVFGLEPAGRERVERTDGVRMESTMQPRTLYLKVNADHPVLGEVAVRRAISLALDRAGLAEAVLRDSDLAASQLFPPSLTAWHQPDLPPLEHDPEAAADLLADAGWEEGGDGIRTRDGERLQLRLLTYPDRPELPALATAIQDELKRVGIQLKVDVNNSSDIPAGHEDGSLELGLLARHLALVTDPLVTVADTFAPEGSDWGAMNWYDREVGDAIDELLGADLDDAAADERRALIAEKAQQQLPVIPVAWYSMNAAVADHVDGFVVDPLEFTWRITDVTWS